MRDRFVMFARPFRLLPLLLLSLAPSPILAGSTVVGNGTPASCTEAALDAAVTVANGSFGIVTFNCGAAPKVIVLSHERALANGVIVDGGNLVTLSGGNFTRIFQLFQGSAVEIRNIQLVNGSAAGGGAILSLGSSEDPSTLTLSNVRLADNSSSLYGGAVAVAQTHLTILNSRIEGNSAGAEGGGGVSANSATLTLTNVDFAHNSAAGEGGALVSWFQTATLTDVTLRGNESVTGNGGAASVRAGTLWGYRLRVDSNRSFGDGGGLWFWEGTVATIEDSSLRWNTQQSGYGAGLYVDAAGSVGLVDTTVAWNRGLGASASSGGGGIANFGVLELTNCTVSGNRTGLLGKGGGIANLDGGLLGVYNSTVAYNEAAVGGGLSWETTGFVEGMSALFVGNLAPGVDDSCSGNPAAALFNWSLWDDASCPAGGGVGNQSSTAVAIAPLAKTCTGLATELTETHAIPAASAAIDNGVCVGGLVLDQRGVTRPQGAACDVGADEFITTSCWALFLDGFEGGGSSRWSAVAP